MRVLVTMDRTKIALVLTAHNEEESLPALVKKIQSFVKGLLSAFVQRLFSNKRLLAVLLLALILRGIMINMPFTGIHSWKEAEFAGMAKLFSEQGDIFTPRYYHIGPHNQVFPMASYLIMLFWGMFGVSNWSTHLPFVLFGVASVAMLYKACRIIYSERISLLASFFLTISPMHTYFSKNAQAESLLVFFMITSAYFFLRWTKTKNQSDCYLSAVSLSLAVLNKYTALFLLLAFIAYLIFSKTKFPSLRMAATSGVIFFLPSLLWLAHVRQFADVYGFSGFSIFLGFPPIGVFLYKLVLGFGWGIGTSLIFTGLILPKFKKEYAFPYFWLLSGLIYVLVGRNMVFANDYYLLPLIPAFCITSALGFNIILEKIRKKTIVVVLLVAIAVTSILFIGVLYSIQHPFKEAGEYVKARTSKTNWILWTESPIMCYYAERYCRGAYNVEQVIKSESKYNVTYLLMTSAIKGAYMTPDYKNHLARNYVLEQVVSGKANILANYGLGGQREYVEIYRRK